jgi:hypothetical protein
MRSVVLNYLSLFVLNGCYTMPPKSGGMCNNSVGWRAVRCGALHELSVSLGQAPQLVPQREKHIHFIVRVISAIYLSMRVNFEF